MASPSSRPSKSAVRTAKPRSAGGAIGGLIGAIIMSVVAGILVTVAVTPVVAMSGLAANSAIGVFENLPNHLNPGQLAQPSTLYAKKGKKTVEIATFYAQNREMVDWNNISQYVKDAAVAAEDPRFYTHGGVDILGVGRATIGELSGNDAGGASTITMQYVRNVLIQQAESIADETERDAAYKDATRRDADRKLKEMRYAISIEKEYSKDQILLGYLNIALFGRTVYGIESAAQYYYGKSAKKLTLSESASLMAIVYWPSQLQLDLEENIEPNTDRRNWILGRMLETGKITQEQHDKAVATEVKPKITPRYSGCTVAEEKYGLGHFCDYVQRRIEQDSSFGNTAEERNFNFLRGGYEIMTTVDLDIQKAGLSAMRQEAPAQMDGINLGAASVSVEVGTGRVLAMVQNRPFADDTDFLKKHKDYTSINYNTNFEDGGSGGFQVGSTFKPITLAEWLRTGHSVREIVNVNGRTVQQQDFKDSCSSEGVYGYGPFTFQNDNLGVRGNHSVQTGIAQSLNGAVMSMQQKLDLCDTIKLAEDLGIRRAAPQENKNWSTYGTTDLTPALSNVYAGIDEIAPITMASAFAAFSGGGKVCTPSPIDSITGPDGEDVPFTGSKCKQAISADVAAGVAYVLKFAVDTVNFVSHARSAYGTPHLAKTGTTDDTLDNWTVGASTEVATATWLGNAGPYCFSKNDCRRVPTINFGGYSGLMAGDQVIWPAMMNMADQKYGGKAFPEPSADALKQTLAKVPDVRGKSFDEASQLLTAAGFGVTDGGTKDSSVSEGLVAGTDPEGGASVPVGSAITIYRSNGKMTELPDVVGMSYRDAVQTLNASGFGSVVGQCSNGDGRPKNNDPVRSMNPGAGNDAKRSSQITLRIDCS
ncbi:transglycosylase domain-containing protein [Leucobacter soli]|uniref:Biosynthetic peptidoglycan transglycosylase n=1 Tax=Leucobacter soli TaxID=2812850 RepID=A0A916JZJ6_9MICO|nr:transglycosylase domain-containing protein [Leucobacter soli]CAG7612882.1 Biosynthetic peptidoglycan transglycosylase [Leucobacter soli]